MDGAMSTALWWVAAAVVGYAIGAINPAALIARVFGIDIRRTGSGNPGATNVTRALGPRWGVLVGFLDILKGFVPLPVRPIVHLVIKAGDAARPKAVALAAKRGFRSRKA